ncbi:Protein stu1 [Smittium mucronatum]|uniref:Protein stu1 n=1 Tax=Smittium mucronatum TaxID=133383 RepID=A0A1R0H5L1_9FUNG|nr:Protein stu1 [Smittium mucronatum]
MILHWAYQTTIDYPNFDPSPFISSIIDQLCDFNDAVRNASKITLQNIYVSRPQIQQIIVDEISQRKNIRPNLISEITVNRRSSSNFRAANIASPYREGLFNRGILSQNDIQFDSDILKSNQKDFPMKKPMNYDKFIRPGSEIGYINPETRIRNLTPDLKKLSIDKPSIGSSAPLNKMSPLDKKSRSILSHTPSKPSLPDAVPLYLDTQKAVEREFSSRSRFFDGKESEENWSNREKSVEYFRRVISGNSPSDYPDELYKELKKILPSLLKALNSLRTTLSIVTIKLFEEIIIKFSERSINLLDFIFENLLGLCSTTKKLVNQAAVNSLSSIVRFTPINEKSLKLLSRNLTSKSIPLRQSCVTISASMVLGGSLELEPSSEFLLSYYSNLIQIGINDSTVSIRNESKALYTNIAQIHPYFADMIYNKSSASTKSILEKLVGNKTSPLSTSAKTGSTTKSNYNSKNFIKNDFIQTPYSPTSSVNHQNLIEKKSIIRPLYSSSYKGSDKNEKVLRTNSRDSYNYISPSEKGQKFNPPKFLSPANNFQPIQGGQKRSVSSSLINKDSIYHERAFTPSIETNSSSPFYPQSLVPEYNYDSSIRFTKKDPSYNSNSSMKNQDSGKIKYPQINEFRNFDSSFSQDFEKNLMPENYNDETSVLKNDSFFNNNVTVDKKNSDFNGESGVGLAPKTEIYDQMSSKYKLELIINSGNFPKLVPSFGIADTSNQLIIDSIEQYFKIQIVIDSVVDYNNGKDYGALYNDFKELSRFIKNDSCSWLWDLVPLPLLNYSKSMYPQKISLEDILYFNENESLFKRFSDAILVTLRLPLDSKSNFAQHLVALDCSRLLIRKRGGHLIMYDDISKLFWELLRFKALNFQSIVGSTDAVLDQLLSSLNTQVISDLFTSFLERCPLPKIKFLLDHDHNLINGGNANEILTPSLITEKSDDPLNLLKSTRILGYGLDMLSTFITKFCAEFFDLDKFMIYIIKAMNHPRTTVRESAIFVAMSIREKLNISSATLIGIMSDGPFYSDDHSQNAEYPELELDYYLKKYRQFIESSYKILTPVQTDFFSYLLLLDSSHRNLISIMSRN